ncbi:gluconate 2-dehydrogenase subunit 3 family protein [Haloplanus sp. GCM10025708]|uniref:gluconate 2-dehydrogenase subunit 3 family protein n=1 Tax=Haloferacaceae TaxID=1644056 RepID=UPI003607A222
MQLTRRDALVALGAAGVAVGGGGAVLLSADRDAAEEADGPLGDAAATTLVAAAEVLYPSAVEDVETFVTEYARGRAADQPAHAAGVADAVAYLDDYARAWHDEPFAALDPSRRREALHRMDADSADPDPEGSDVERVRYYVVDELLFALYSSPTGGELVGIENPRGYPGGTASYRRGPTS